MLLIIGHLQERITKLSTNSKFNIRSSLINHFARTVITEQAQFFSSMKSSIIGKDSS